MFKTEFDLTVSSINYIRPFIAHSIGNVELPATKERYSLSATDDNHNYISASLDNFPDGLRPGVKLHVTIEQA